MITRARSVLAAKYAAELRAHLRRRSLGKSDPARTLGRQAHAIGMRTRDLTLIHERALESLSAANEIRLCAPAERTRARIFLAESLAPLDAAANAAQRVNRILLQRIETLRSDTAALDAGNRHLAREVARRKAGEAAVEKGKRRYKILLKKSEVMQRKLHTLTRKIISAQEEERKEISRELHDQVVQTLVGINVQLTALGNAASADLTVVRERIAAVQRLVESSVHAVHGFARKLRPAVLDDLGLIPALHAYCKSVAAREKFKIELTASAGVEDLHIAKRTVLYRVAQEALTNVVRHSEATLVQVLVTSHPGIVRLVISDNGRSFEVEKLLNAPNRKRLGLLGMSERIESVGGTLSIVSVPKKGTVVKAEIPFKAKNRSHP